MASIYRRENGVWYVKGKLQWPNGEVTLIRHSLKTTSRTEATAAKKDLHRRELEAKAGMIEQVRPSDLTVSQVIDRFMEHAKEYYRKPDGTATSELSVLDFALAPLRAHFGVTLAKDFGPLALQELRERYIEKGWARSNINGQVHRVRRVFKWAASKELIPETIYPNLCAVGPLKPGRSDAKETEAIKPVSLEHVEIVKQRVSRQVAAMIDMQLLTGARPGEIMGLRPMDVDQTGDVWTATLTEHKTAHKGKSRTIYLGPRAQAVLRPFLLRPAEVPCFDPREAESERHARAKGHRRANQKPNPKQTDRRVADRYTTASYRRSIARACEQAEIDPWHPNQLRHTAATLIRKKHGVEAAQVMLGHSRADVTQVYAESNAELAMQVAQDLG